MDEVQFISQWLFHNLNLQQEAFDRLISATPSGGDLRNKITNANIHFGQARALLAEVIIAAAKTE